MLCVKYCVFTFPLVVTAVQTHGGVQSALRRIHAPTRNEAGTYIRASIASDLDTLSTLNIPSHQGMMMDIFFVGWVGGTPERFLFSACSRFALPYSVWLGRSVFCFCVVLFCLLGFSWSLSLFPAFSVDRVLPRMSVLILTALCCPYLFLVCLAFPPCLVK